MYLDDILISSSTEEERLKSIAEVLERLSKAGLRAKKHKCRFMVPAVEFLGHLVDAQGLRPLPEKIRAVRDTPTPTNITELKAYLGLILYYGKFLPNLSTHLTPLYHGLLNKDVPWQWSSAQEAAFQNSKKLLMSAKLLTHYDPQLPVVLACDASAYGIGAVLAHQMPDGTERPIAYASRTLNPSERNYSRIEKEGYDLKFRRTKEHANADALSRLSLTDTTPESKTPPELVLLIDHLNDSPVSAEQIKKATRQDPTLATAIQYIQQGWPHKDAIPDPLKPYYDRREELSVFDGCILWGNRVVVPRPH